MRKFSVAVAIVAMMLAAVPAFAASRGGHGGGHSSGHGGMHVSGHGGWHGGYRHHYDRPFFHL
jgi:hypothetical protein